MYTFPRAKFADTNTLDSQMLITIAALVLGVVASERSRE